MEPNEEALACARSTAYSYAECLSMAEQVNTYLRIFPEHREVMEREGLDLAGRFAFIVLSGDLSGARDTARFLAERQNAETTARLTKRLHKQGGRS